jgi:bifunctional UDP-N-acetylglucosamine pyrophosphorylase / glucosamine-1-phosphate N-acetyltransferase
MTATPLMIVVLAAGKGTRMKSDLPKVMHQVGGRSMLGHVLALARAASADRTVVVVGPGMDNVRAATQSFAPEAEVFVQENQLGTADAVKSAHAAIAAHQGDVMVLYADTPLILTDTIARLRATLEAGTSVAVLGFDAEDPEGYGRLITQPDGTLDAIREDKDASEAEREIRLCNSGVMAFRVPDLAGVLSRIGNANAKGEYYLTDAVQIIRADGGRAAVVRSSQTEMLGVNSRVELAEAEALFQARRRREVMEGGATLIAPETVWFSHDTVIGRDVTIQPNVFFGPDVVVEDGAEILANCHFEKARIGKAARVGPFARLRPGAKLGEHVRVGNFVEVKNLEMQEGAKANHLSYLGDGIVGPKANIGAGTIFCNYDGFFKHRTNIGAGAFVGSNSSLVAPVTIGEGAYIGSGSVISKDVSPGALALERTTQDERPGWAEKFRIMMTKRKAAAAKG